LAEYGVGLLLADLGAVILFEAVFGRCLIFRMTLMWIKE